MANNQQTDQIKKKSEYGSGTELGSDYTLMVVMVALILFCISAWLAFGQLSKSLDKKIVTPSLPGEAIPIQ